MGGISNLQKGELILQPNGVFYITGIVGIHATVLSWFKVTVVGNISLDGASSM